jgi:hypothetical protein
MENLTLETLPKAFALLTNEVSEIKRLLLEKEANNQLKPTVGLTSTNFANYHPDKPSKPTVYGWVT